MEIKILFNIIKRFRTSLVLHIIYNKICTIYNTAIDAIVRGVFPSTIFHGVLKVRSYFFQKSSTQYFPLDFPDIQHQNINPLTANDKYIGHLAGTACRRRSAFHRQNHEKRPRIF